MSKKTIVLGLVAVIALVAVVGCSKKSATVATATDIVTFTNATGEDLTDMFFSNAGAEFFNEKDFIADKLANGATLILNKSDIGAAGKYDFNFVGASGDYNVWEFDVTAAGPQVVAVTPAEKAVE